MITSANISSPPLPYPHCFRYYCTFIPSSSISAI